ncbi:unnamed protein product [Arctogadus glacialis]
MDTTSEDTPDARAPHFNYKYKLQSPNDCITQPTLLLRPRRTFNNAFCFMSQDTKVLHSGNTRLTVHRATPPWPRGERRGGGAHWWSAKAPGRHQDPAQPVLTPSARHTAAVLLTLGLGSAALPLCLRLPNHSRRYNQPLGAGGRLTSTDTSGLYLAPDMNMQKDQRTGEDDLLPNADWRHIDS